MSAPTHVCDLCMRPIDGPHVMRGPGLRFHRDCGTEYGRMELETQLTGGSVRAVEMVSRASMISAFWAYLCSNAGETVILDELQRLTDDEREQFDHMINLIRGKR